RAEHRREAARFWRENREEAAQRERLQVPPEEYERLERALERALEEHRRQEEERIQQVLRVPPQGHPCMTTPPPDPQLSPQIAAGIREAERRQRETVREAMEVGEPGAAMGWAGSLHNIRNIFLFFLNCTQLQAETELCPGPSVCSPPAGPGRGSPCGAEQPGPSGMQTGPDFTWMEPGPALTFIGHQVGVTPSRGGLKAHLRAKPPWLTEEEGGSKQEIGPSYEEFLRQKEKQKLKKLPAERVGANFDHASETGDGWLPSFGRVWNHGRRWQSR
ncbi:CCD84 protein, partial [Pterocles burchelli]|nr:CCD84 protein [Pterocles burchelli]